MVPFVYLEIAYGHEIQTLFLFFKERLLLMHHILGILS